MKHLFKSLILLLLMIEARAVLQKYRPAVILVTGSVGKTSTKEAIYAALTRSVFVRKSEKSYNSDIGVPLTILGVPNGWSNAVSWIRNVIDGAMMLLMTVPYPQWLVLEVGADRPGDLSRTLAWLRPSVVVATPIPEVPVHVEFYDSPESVFIEESFPLSLLAKGGTAVVPSGDARLISLPLPSGIVRMSYGETADAEVRAMRIRTLTMDGMPTGTSFDVMYQGERAHVTLAGAIGGNHATAVAAGIAAAIATGISFATAAAGFSGYSTPPGRMRLIPGVKGTVIIDDTYNSSPVAAHEALATLASLPGTGRKIAVLGDMMELGGHSVVEHEKVGRAAVEVDLLVTVGVRARGIAAGAVAAGKPESAVSSFERGADAASYLLATLAPGDVVLVKGSQSVRLERVTKALMAEPGRAKDLLCRQDDAWLTR